jgi:hypothetical protein
MGLFPEYETIYRLKITQQGWPPKEHYYGSHAMAKEAQDEFHADFLLNHLRTANRIKGALRGKGTRTIRALAHGIVAENLQFEITPITVVKESKEDE